MYATLLLWLDVVLLVALIANGARLGPAAARAGAVLWLILAGMTLLWQRLFHVPPADAYQLFAIVGIVSLLQPVFNRFTHRRRRGPPSFEDVRRAADERGVSVNDVLKNR